MKEELSDEDLVKALERLDRFASLTDAKFKLPVGNIRFGLDSIIGLIPIVGDVFGFVLSFYLFFEAQKLGIPASVRLKMARNVVLDLLIGLIPVFGDIGDVAYRANLRNVKLIVEHIEAEQNRRLSYKPEESRYFRWFALVAVILGLCAIAAYVAYTYQ